VSRCIRLWSAMRRDKAYIITGCTGPAARYVRPAQQNLPFAVIGTIAYCSRTYLDVQTMTISAESNCNLYPTVVFTREFLGCENLFVEIVLSHSLRQ